MTEKACTICSVIKPRSDFYPRAKGSPYINACCKDCSLDQARTPEGKERLRALNERRGKAGRDFIDSFKTDPCMDCGVTYPPYVMDFDHRDPTTKTGRGVSWMTKSSREAVIAEIAKCDLVCANCHRIRTFA